MMYWGNHMGTGGWIFSILSTLIILGVIAALIGWAVSTRRDRDGGATATGPSARETLDRRLASGELTTEQYAQIRETLGGAAPPAGDPRPRTPAGAPV